MSLSRTIPYLAMSAILLTGLLTGCNTSTEHLASVKDNAVKTFHFEQGYREVYDNILKTGKRCSDGQSGPKLVGELQAKDNYGKISRSTTSAGIISYSLLIRIEKISTGSKLTIFSSNNPGADKIFRWAKGDQSCE